ncbi:methyltransferase domain-containing protein [Caulobacter sp. 17J80-11]|uniref:methyltransferase domain-containing protein n=1 Tax=Caulobacter sp. 17J80-11 TaxID=2763502 RepID=UPI001653BCD8|nr:methyltransferase domain-containing protein [Caulobacter sp. 17J80-11]MBC6980737.1 methyltransferase domain-containing protein [Caulobacter sp. 17J80-11]
MAEKDQNYLLGTHDEEIARLGLQHRVWRPRVLDAWRRAGITEGSTVVDAGAGPGWASVDLAEIVGATGRVHALERSERFLAYLNAVAAQRGLDNVSTHNLDLVLDALPVANADAFWVRWVLAFVSDPRAVLAKLASTLRPGGVAVIHEYLDYGTWAFAPAQPMQEAFRDFVTADWRASGGEPEIGRFLPAMLPEAGFRIKELRPIVDVVPPTNFVWQWPASFAKTYPEHLVQTGKRDRAWADQVIAEYEAAEKNPNAMMVTPMVLEVIAERV